MLKGANGLTVALCIGAFLSSCMAVGAERGVVAPRGSIVTGNAASAAPISINISAGDARQWAVENRLTGYRPLPPGIARNLARGKPLPPGIAKQMAPGPMLSRLPRYDGYEWQVAGTDLILVAIGTAVVAEILSDVFR